MPEIGHDLVPAGWFRRGLRRTFPDDVRHRVWNRLYAMPGVVEFMMFADPAIRPRRITRHTDLVMDGVARCGNTYAEAAFRYANGADARLAHHFHSPLAIQLGVKHGLPTILLIRDPKDCLASAMQFHPMFKADEGLRAYRFYYESVEPLLDNIVVADFPQVTSDFGAVIDRCNERFGTTFNRYERTDESEQAIVRMIDTVGSLAHSTDRFEQAVSRPSATRRSSSAMTDEFSADDWAELDAATAVYRRIVPR